MVFSKVIVGCLFMKMLLVLFFVFIGLLYVDFFLCKIFLKKGVVLGVMFVVCVVLFLIWYLLWWWWFIMFSFRLFNIFNYVGL